MYGSVLLALALVNRQCCLDFGLLMARKSWQFAADGVIGQKLLHKRMASRWRLTTIMRCLHRHVLIFSVW